MMERQLADGDQAEDPTQGLALPLKWVIPEGISSRYATEMRVQHTDQEFVLSFFETVPPILFGTQSEQLEQARKLDGVETVCVARIVVSAKRMPAFAKAIESGLERYQRLSATLSGQED